PWSNWLIANLATSSRSGPLMRPIGKFTAEGAVARGRRNNPQNKAAHCSFLCSFRELLHSARWQAAWPVRCWPRHGLLDRVNDVDPAVKRDDRHGKGVFAMPEKRKFHPTQRGDPIGRPTVAPMAIVYRAIDTLQPDPANPRRHSKKQVRQIAGSIRIFGFNVPILIDREGRVIAGHGRLLAAGELGMTEV